MLRMAQIARIIVRTPNRRPATLAKCNLVDGISLLEAGNIDRSIRLCLIMQVQVVTTLGFQLGNNIKQGRRNEKRARGANIC